MKNFKKILVFLSMVILLSGCSTIKKGFQPDKRSGEEFLVEKKSPLVMPPEFNDLPIPNKVQVVKENRKSGVKSLLMGSKDKTAIEEKDQSTSPIEKLILKQIKKN
tara:strand:- start:328 stop:645 length:318 start_codon:yes stop_codon:yes gene_type:complete